MQTVEIMKYLPQRYPFLMCDKIISHEYLKSAIGIKNVTANEPYFQGHFPGDPIMPGVMILEAMAQIGGFVFLADEINDGEPLKGYIAGFDKIKFLKKVLPGDTLRVEAKFMNKLGSLAKADCIATVDGNKVACAQICYKF